MKRYSDEKMPRRKLGEEAEGDRTYDPRKPVSHLGDEARGDHPKSKNGLGNGYGKPDDPVPEED